MTIKLFADTYQADAFPLADSLLPLSNHQHATATRRNADDIPVTVFVREAASLRVRIYWRPNIAAQRFDLP